MKIGRRGDGKRGKNGFYSCFCLFLQPFLTHFIILSFFLYFVVFLITKMPFIVSYRVLLLNLLFSFLSSFRFYQSLAFFILRYSEIKHYHHRYIHSIMIRMLPLLINDCLLLPHLPSLAILILLNVIHLRIAQSYVIHPKGTLG